MKKIAIILTVLAVSMPFTFGQTASDSISIKKVFGGCRFYQGEQRLIINQVVNLMTQSKQAYKQITSAQSYRAIAAVLGCTGGFMVFAYLKPAMYGEEPHWAMAGVGAGLLVVAIPISQRYYKKAKQAVETYNGGLQTSSFWDKNELKLTLTGNGIGLTLNF